MSHPNVVVLGGPNGSGKSTAAVRLLHQTLSIMEFVNADQIARGLSPFNPEGVAVHAGRLMLERIDELSQRNESFAFETTLASRTFATFIKRLQQERGYHFRLVYIWLRDPYLNVDRVALRVESGGHNVPELTIRRRYYRSVRNLFELYLPLADTWEVFDNSHADFMPVAAGEAGGKSEVMNSEAWSLLKEAYDSAGNE
ncbi:MAG TPA: zeta toxin family protein [Planctomycetaceae bacterium]|nr:zeta toxin family protein [Planctomycetaceae bacterium]